MVGGRRVLAGKDDVVEVVADCPELATVGFLPARHSGDRQGPFGIQPPAVRQRIASLRIIRKRGARSGIASTAAVRRLERGGDVRTRAEAGINEVEFTQ